jgi:hypothetical protein
MATKQILIQTQNLDSPRITVAKPVGWCAINFDGIRLIIDGYNGFPCLNQPREDSMVQIVDDRQVHELTPEQLLEAVKFYKQYHAMGSDVVCYKNVFHNVLPDLYKNACKRKKSGLEI